ncbi:MAG: 3D domain-containing protein [Kiritimatiellae bacterium]|nr:3D domain-containing protein [Kiritimatiellia bacterium]
MCIRNPQRNACKAAAGRAGLVLSSRPAAAWPRILVLCAAATFLCGCGSVRPPRGVAPTEREMLVTGYCRCGKCCGWRRNWYGRPVHSEGPLKGKPKRVEITASGRRAWAGVTIAADTRLYPFGTILYVPGWGYGRVEDVGRDIKGHHIDLYFSTHRRALRWGKKRLRVKVWKAKTN